MLSNPIKEALPLDLTERLVGSILVDGPKGTSVALRISLYFGVVHGNKINELINVMLNSVLHNHCKVKYLEQMFSSMWR